MSHLSLCIPAKHRGLASRILKNHGYWVSQAALKRDPYLINHLPSGALEGIADDIVYAIREIEGYCDNERGTFRVRLSTDG